MNYCRLIKNKRILKQSYFQFSNLEPKKPDDKYAELWKSHRPYNYEYKYREID